MPRALCADLRLDRVRLNGRGFLLAEEHPPFETRKGRAVPAAFAEKFDPSVLQLDWSDLDGQIVVTPRDKDRYVVRVRTAIDRISRGVDFEKFDEQLKLLQRVLAEWLQGRNGIRQAYLTIRDGGFLFLVVTTNSEYDEEFDDALTDLDIRIAADPDFEGISLDVLALPNVSQQSVDHFLDAGLAMEYAKASTDAK